MTKFTRYTLDEDFTKPDTINVRFNRQEREWLEALKLSHNTPKDSTALKNEAFRLFKLQDDLAKIRSQQK